LSQSALPLYFGLGAATKIDRIEITWPSGKKQIVEKDLAPNTLLNLVDPKDQRCAADQPLREKQRPPEHEQCAEKPPIIHRLTRIRSELMWKCTHDLQCCRRQNLQ